MPNIVRNLVYLDIGYRCLLFDTLQVWKTIFADLKWGAILHTLLRCNLTILTQRPY